MSFAELAPAFRSRNFRLFWIAQLISTVGTAFQLVAEGYLVFQVTQSTFWLGAVNFIGLLPVVPVSLLGGVLIDRLPRRRLIMLTQFGLLLQALLFAGLVLTDSLRLWHLIALYALFGSLIAIDNPARRAFLVDIVERDQLANAIGLNATLFNVSTLVGYAAGGWLIATLGAGGALSLNALTYLFPIAALGMMRVADVGHDQGSKPIGGALTEGIQAIVRQPLLLGLMLLMALAGGLAYPAMVGQMPAFSELALGGSARTLGVLMSFGALGSIIGTFVVAQIQQHRGRALWLAGICLPLLIVLFGRTDSTTTAAVAVTAIGIVLLIVQSLATTLIQEQTSDRLRGRVMSLFSMGQAAADVGSNLVVGTLALSLGLPLAFGVGGGLACLLVVAIGLMLPAVRRLA